MYAWALLPTKEPAKTVKQQQLAYVAAEVILSPHCLYRCFRGAPEQTTNVTDESNSEDASSADPEQLEDERGGVMSRDNPYNDHYYRL